MMLRQDPPRPQAVPQHVTHAGSIARRSTCALLLAAVCAAGQAPSSPAAQPANHRPTVELTMPKALAMAAAHNRHIQLASLGTQAAQQKRDIAKADYFPHIKNDSTALYLTSLEGVVIPAGAFSQAPPAGVIPAKTLTIGQGQADAFTSGTGLVQPFTQLFAVHAGVQAADADLAIARLQASDTDDAIALQVHKLYYAILTRQLQLTAAQASIQAGIVTEQEAARSVADGSALEVTQLQSHAQLLQEKQASLATELAIDDLMMQFDDVLGLPLGTRLALDPDSLGDAPTLPSADDAIALLKSHNPSIQTAQQDVEKARAGVAAAKDAYIPNISGLARYSYQSGVPLLVHNFGTFGGVVSYDLFDGGTREAKLKAAKIQLHAAEVQLAQTQSDLSVQVYALYDEIEKMQQLEAVASETVVVDQESERLATERVKRDAALPSAPPQAHAALASAQASLLETQLNLRLLQNQVLQFLGQRPQ